VVRIWVALLFAAALVSADCPAEGPLWLVQVRVLGGAAAPDFVLTVDGKPRAICDIANESAAASIAIVWDTSGSMSSKYSDGTRLEFRAADRFLRAASSDEWLVAEVGATAQVRVPFTTDKSAVAAGLRPIALGRTALLDGIYVALGAMQGARCHMRSVVVFSDGVDNSSKQTIGALTQLEQRLHVPVFLVASALLRRNEAMEPMELHSARAALARWVLRTGGYRWEMQTENDADKAVDALNGVLRSRYLLRFAGPPGKIKVEARNKPRPTLLYRSDPEPAR
jgi:hypothetical protein